MDDRLRLEYATEIFLAESRKQFVRLNPGRQCPVKSLRNYPEAQRSALMMAISRAIDATDAKSEASYLNWKLSRLAGNQ